MLAVRNNVLRAVPIVYSRLENRNLLLSDLSAPGTPYQLFCFAAEHAPANDFDPTCVPWNIVKLRSVHTLPSFLFGTIKILFAEGVRKELPHLENLHLAFSIDHEEIYIAGKVHEHLAARAARRCVP